MSIPFKTTLHSAASATANGTAVPVAGYSVVAVQLSGTFTATITFEASIDASNWIAIPAVNANSRASATTATSAGIYIANVAGFDLFRARLTWSSGTSITATALASNAGVQPPAAA